MAPTDHVITSIRQFHELDNKVHLHVLAAAIASSILQELAVFQQHETWEVPVSSADWMCVQSLASAGITQARSI